MFCKLKSNGVVFLQAPRAVNPPAPAGPGSCNPLYEDGCNPLTATRFATPPEAYQAKERDEAASLRVAPAAAEQTDPYAMYRDAFANANRVPADPYAMYRQAANPAPPPARDPFAMLRQYMAQAQVNDPHAPRAEAVPEADPSDPYAAMREAAAAMHRRAPPSARQQYPFAAPTHEEPTQDQRHPLGPPGKTKEGYDCFIGYDRECYPVKPRSGGGPMAPRPAESYEPHLNGDGTRSGVLEPANPHCDPEYDPDCRLRRYEPEQGQAEAHAEAHGAAEGGQEPEQQEQDQYEAEPYQSGQEEPHMSYPQGMPSLQDILRHYGDRFPEQDDHRAYADDYRRK